MSVVAHVTNDIESVKHKLAPSIPSADKQKLTKWKQAEASATKRQVFFGQSISRIPVAQRKQNKQKSKSTKNRKSASAIVISPNKSQTRTNITESHCSESESESESDCEIIENITQIIVVDDDDVTDKLNKANEPNTLTEPNETVDSVDGNRDSTCDSSINSLETTKDITIETSTPIESEEAPLFFIDTNPGTDFTAPIYEINSNPIKNTIENMASNVRNIRITIPNKENRPNFDTSFAPNPLLSSTLLTTVDNRDDESEEIITSSSSNQTGSEPTNFCISINSTCENGASRQVSVGRSSPVLSAPKVTNGKSNGNSKITINNNNNNNNNNKNKNNNSQSNSPSKPIKRKAEKENHRDEPPSKRSYADSSDVILVNDTISDGEEDSVIFVSETIENQSRNRIMNTIGGKALDFISLPVNDNRNQNKKSPKSTRAKRRQEKKKAIQSNSIGKKTKNKLSRFNINAPMSQSYDKFSSFVAPASSVPLSSVPSTSVDAEKKNITLDYEKEKKLFADKPELFEKRFIVIDGSNVAYAHGTINRSFSIKGIEICIKHFEDLGFKVKAVVPQMRLKRSQSTDPDALERLKNAGKVVITPCKNLPGRKAICYDDRNIMEIAERFDGVVISNDNYSDLLGERPNWDEIIRERVVGFSWCDDFIMIPQDPYGKNGRSLPLILNRLKTDAKIDVEVEADKPE